MSQIVETVGAAACEVPAEGAGNGPTAMPHGDLKRRTARGALVSTASQVASLVLRTGSLIILARILIPADFGLVGMVTAITGFLSLFRDAGLSMATVQRESVTQAQTSTLFWINLGVGAFLAAICGILGPVLSAFYGEPRLVWITIALGTGFIFNGASAQHRAILLRDLRFSVIAAVEITALVLSTAIGLGMAWSGQGYWALVGMAIAQPAIGSVGVWLVTRWVPGLPQWGCGVGSMLRYGGTVTLNSVIVYVAYNAEKVLLGRFWGAEALGVYGRAYQLINIPTENLNSTIGTVAFPALARVQNDPPRLRSYFLRGYSTFLAIVMPITVACALFAEELVHVFLGPGWNEAIPVFRFLAPTILAFALMNPFAWLMLATGKTTRSLKIALMIAPVVICGYFLGLGRGPEGVAAGFSISMLLLISPMILWAKQGTGISNRDVLGAIVSPLLSVLAGAALVVLLRGPLAQVQSDFLRLVLGNVVLFGVYATSLLFVMKQHVVYVALLREAGILSRKQS